MDSIPITSCILNSATSMCERHNRSEAECRYLIPCDFAFIGLMWHCIAHGLPISVDAWSMDGGKLKWNPYEHPCEHGFREWSERRESITN